MKKNQKVEIIFEKVSKQFIWMWRAHERVNSKKIGVKMR